jgi:hypothetical protein
MIMFRRARGDRASLSCVFGSLRHRDEFQSLSERINVDLIQRVLIAVMAATIAIASVRRFVKVDGKSGTFIGVLYILVGEVFIEEHARDSPRSIGCCSWILMPRPTDVHGYLMFAATLIQALMYSDIDYIFLIASREEGAGECAAAPL